MAQIQPQIYLPDATTTATIVIFSSNVKTQMISGYVDPNAIDVQVQIRGAGFVSDPTLVALDLPNFQIPNPASYPDGLTMLPGDNQIDVRSVDVSGNLSLISSVTIRYVTSRELALQVTAPTGIEMQRNKDSITLVTSKNPEPAIVGYNFYASKESGGVLTGYFKINQAMVSQSFSVLEDTTLSQEDVTYHHHNGTLHVSVTEENGTTLVQDISNSYTPLVGTYTDQVLTLNVTARQPVEYFKFEHDRNGSTNEGFINNEQFLDVNNDQPLFYVITAVGYDAANREYVESRYSAEFVGLPLIIDTTIKDMTPRTRQDIILSEMKTIQLVNPDVSLIPGSTTRDIHIDPPASEMERLGFIADFIHRAQSFLTLLAIDDPNSSGTSIAVRLSSYKQALRDAFQFTTDTATQALIDDAFDKRAGDYNVLRLGAQKSIGQEVFYTSTRPTRDMTIARGDLVGTIADAELGIPAVTFEVTSTVVLPLTSLDSYYNTYLKRWEITANIRAVTPGSDGNRPAGQIKKIVSGATGFSCTNDKPTAYGYSIESNRHLAERAMLSLSSVDSGTTTGYLATASRVPMVQEAIVVEAANEYMMRDWDDLRLKHIGGKVDIWVKGLNEQEVTDTFAFMFETATNTRFETVDAPTYTFRSLDPSLSVDNPLTEMLDVPSKGYGFRNVTKGTDFNLAGVTYVDYRTIRLVAAPPFPQPPQPPFDPEDIIVGDYRYQVSNQFVTSRQPVRRIISVVGEVSGTLSADTNYLLYKLEDPLLEGESTRAHDYIQIMRYNGIPSGATIVVNDERHVLVGSRAEALGSIGVDPASVRIFDTTRVIEYHGPESSTPDFLIVAGTATTPTHVVRLSTGAIANGQEVSIDYSHDENFTVRYVVNDLLRTVQSAIDVKKHATADVVVKQAIDNVINIENTVILISGADRSLADSNIRTRAVSEVDNRPIGGGARQSDVIHAIEGVKGVDYVVVPFSKMAWADDSLVLRDALYNNYVHVSSLDSGTNRVFILVEPLSAATIDGGGPTNRHRGVFMDSQAMTLTTVTGIAHAPSQAFIIGAGGLSIVGFSDNATLTAEGFTSDEWDAERKKRTANHVLVSLDIADDPSHHDFTCSFITAGDTGTKDIVVGALSVASIGTLNIIYDET
jgi:hypothetical protein